uniref:Uncharacterized protein n=1 Tax=Strigamia maritima TaxID=126957 RepID=T1ISD7_STRMM
MPPTSNSTTTGHFRPSSRPNSNAAMPPTMVIPLKFDPTAKEDTNAMPDHHFTDPGGGGVSTKREDSSPCLCGWPLGRLTALLLLLIVILVVFVLIAGLLLYFKYVPYQARPPINEGKIFCFFRRCYVLCVCGDYSSHYLTRFNIVIGSKSQ